jgi:Outer membrane protein beta-barrel domain
MRLSLKSSAVIVTLAAMAIAPSILFAGNASARPITFDDSYIGAGVSAGVTNGGQNNDAANLGGNIQGRIAIPNAPVSVRGAVLFNGDSATVIPTVTYDLPVSQTANIYAGVGGSFVDKSNQPTPLGNRNAVVLTAGAEAGVAKNVVVYGDAKWGINAYENSKADALSFQAGVGYRF